MTETQSRISSLKDRVGNAWRLIKIDEKKQRVIELQAEMGAPGFWNDQERAKKVGQEASDLEFEVEAWREIDERNQGYFRNG